MEKTTVLIVDDNESLSRSMSFVLNRKGYDVATAPNGSEAVKRVKEISFDVIFMDIKMPGLNGVETFKKIKKISPSAIVVMMTAYALEELVQEALTRGAHGVLYKPLVMDEVFKMIDGINSINKDKKKQKL